MRTTLTRQGWIVLAAAVPTLVVGRLFGVIELYVIGAALGLATLFGLVLVAVRRPRGAGAPLDPPVGAHGW